MAVDDVVAHAQVRIRPDFTGFREELKAKLDAAVAAAGRRVKVGVDESSIVHGERAQLASQARVSEAQAKANVRNAEHRARLDAQNAAHAVRQEQAREQATRRRLDQLTAQNRKQQSSETARLISAGKQLDARSKIILDDAEFKIRMSRVTDQLNNFSKRIADARVNVKGDEKAKAQLDGLALRLDRIGSRTAEGRIGINGVARSSAELTVLDHQLDKIGRAHKVAFVDVIIRKFGSGGGDGFGGGGFLNSFGSVLPGGARPSQFALAGLGLSLGPSLIPALAAAASATAAGGLGALGGLGAGFLGLQQVPGAVKASQAKPIPQPATIERQAAAARAVSQSIASSEAVANARQRLSDTIQQTALDDAAAEQRVRDAETAVTDAVKRVSDAQTVLTQVRRDAVRQIQDLRNAEVDSALSERAARLALVDARRAEYVARFSLLSTDEDRQKAVLGVAEAEQRLKEATLGHTRAAQDRLKSDSEGVSRNPQVLAAHDAVLRALRAQTDARRLLKQAEADDARVAVSGAHSVRDAQRAVGDSLREQGVQALEAAAANSRAASATSEAWKNAQKVLAGLPQSVRSFAAYVSGPLTGAFHRLRTIAENAFLPKLQLALERIFGKNMPQFQRITAGFATALGNLALRFASMLDSPGGKKFLDWMEKTGPKALTAFGLIFLNLGKGLANLFLALGSQPIDALNGVAAATGRWADSMGRIADSPNFKKFVDTMRRDGPLWAKTFSDVAGAVVSISAFLEPISHIMVGLLDHVAKFAKDHPGGFLAILFGTKAGVKIGGLAGRLLLGKRFLGLGALAGEGGVAAAGGAETGVGAGIAAGAGGGSALGPVGAAVGALAVGAAIGGKILYDKNSGFKTWWDKNVGPMITDMKSSFKDMYNQSIKPFLQDIKNAWNGLFGRALRGILSTQMRVLADALKGALKVLHGVFDIFAGLFTGKWSRVWEGVKLIFIGAFQGLSAPFREIWKTLSRDFEVGINSLIGVLNAVPKGINWLLAHIPGFPDSVRLPLIPTIHIAPRDAGRSPTQNRQGRPLSTLPGAESGTRIGSGFETRGPQVIVGEGHPAHPEYVIPTDPAHRKNALKLFESLGGRLMDNGGVLGDLIHRAKSLPHDVAGIFGKLRTAALGPVLDKAEAPARALIHHLPGELFQKMGLWLLSHLNNWIVGRAESVPGTLGAAPTAPADVTGAQSLGKRLAQSMFGWSGQNWNALFSLWMKESGWRYNADNPTSSAYGIPQSLPGSKMASEGADWMTNPATQIRWGLKYIAGRYGDPIQAWAHSQSLGWYDKGGVVGPGLSHIVNGTGRPEMVLTERQWQAIYAAATRTRSSNIHVHASPGMDVGALANEVDRRLGWGS